MKRNLIRKQFELLHNALGVMAEELADVKDSFYLGNIAVRMRRCNPAKWGRWGGVFHRPP